MDFELTPEQREIQALARDFVRAEVEPHAAQWDRAHGFPRELLSQAGEVGLPAHGVQADAEAVGAAIASCQAVTESAGTIPVLPGKVVFLGIERGEHRLRIDAFHAVGGDVLDGSGFLELPGAGLGKGKLPAACLTVLQNGHGDFGGFQGLELVQGHGHFAQVLALKDHLRADDPDPLAR